MSSRDAYIAIADPTRREILGLLRDRGMLTAGEIAASFASVWESLTLAFVPRIVKDSSLRVAALR